MSVPQIVQTNLEARDDRQIDSMVNRIAALETRLTGRIVELEARMESCNHGGAFLSRLAEELSLVGLRETLTCPRHTVKYIWAAVFCFGVAATVYYLCSTTAEYLDNPTATNVALQRPQAYEYPYMVICPRAWIDLDKATARGLSVDAIKYSLGYVDQLIVSSSEPDLKNARDEFLRFYSNHNYSSLLDYFKDMATELEDLRSNGSIAPFALGNTSSYFCDGCVENLAPLEIVPVADAMCYAFSFSPVDTVHYHGTSAPVVWFKFQDKTRHVFGHSSNIRIFVVHDKRVTQPESSAIVTEPYTSVMLSTNPQRFITVHTDDNPCRDESDESHYSAQKCIITCLGNVMKERFDCYRFSYSGSDKIGHPGTFCNYFDTVPGTNMTMWDVLSSNELDIIESKEGAQCVQQCPFHCDRMIGLTTLDSKFQIKKTVFDMLQRAQSQNMTLLSVMLSNTAISLGGVLTFTEVSTFSLSTLVGNVGGTLGLFVGGTVLTFFQLVMVLINYILDKRATRRVSTNQQEGQTNGIVNSLAGKKVVKLLNYRHREAA